MSLRITFAAPLAILLASCWAAGLQARGEVWDLRPVREDRSEEIVEYEGVADSDLSEAHLKGMLDHFRPMDGTLLTVPSSADEEWEEGWRDYGGARDVFSVSSSSQLSSPQNAYAAERAFDRKAETAWVEGAAGNGKGEWLGLTFKSPFRDEQAFRAAKRALDEDEGAEEEDSVVRPLLAGIAVVPGYAKSLALFHANARPKTLRADLRFRGKSGTTETRSFRLHLDDAMRPQFFQTEGLDDQPLYGDIELKLVLEAIYPGAQYEDTCISEVRLFFADGP